MLPEVRLAAGMEKHVENISDGHSNTSVTAPPHTLTEIPINDVESDEVKRPDSYGDATNATGASTSSQGDGEAKGVTSRRRVVITFPGAQLAENLRSAQFGAAFKTLFNFLGTQIGLIQGVVNYDDSEQLLAAQDVLRQTSPWLRVSHWPLLAEFAAMFAIVSMALVVGNNPSRFYLIGALMGVFTYLNGHISGGHSNPAITLACWLRGKMDGHAALLYVVCQTLGAILGAAITWGWYLNRHASTAQGHVPLLLEPHPRFEAYAVGFCELFYLAIACLLFLTLTSTRANRDNDHYEVIYGCYYAVACAVSTNLTRSYLNPAVAIGTALTTAFAKGSAPWLWFYLGFDVLAALLAATWFRLINVADLGHNSLPPTGRNQNVHMQGAFD